MLRVKFAILWYDCWIGFYFDRKNKALYFAPFFCLIFKFWIDKDWWHWWKNWRNPRPA